MARNRPLWEISLCQRCGKVWEDVCIVWRYGIGMSTCLSLCTIKGGQCLMLFREHLDTLNISVAKKKATSSSPTFTSASYAYLIFSRSEAKRTKEFDYCYCLPTCMQPSQKKPRVFVMSDPITRRPLQIATCL